MTASLVPDARQPCTNSGLSCAIASRFFLPIALRRSSASGPEKPAIDLAICIDCSWYRITPLVGSVIGRRRSSMYVIVSGLRFAHPLGLELEHAHRIPARHHLEGLRVVQRERRHVDPLARRALDDGQRVL